MVESESSSRSPESKAGESFSPQPVLFIPAWDVLPHEGKLPHADTISDRLQTLVALSRDATRNPQRAPLVVASVTALLQKTFPPGEIQNRTRTLARGDKINPLDLIEWLEEQGCEPEAQVTQKGEIALRGGILDVWPLTSPWPVRLEFFGDELESLRHFDPLTQISREEIAAVTLPPGGELGILQTVAGRPKCPRCGIRRPRTGCSPRCSIICHAKPFFSSANRSNSPSAPTNTRSKFPQTIHFSFRGPIFSPNSNRQNLTRQFELNVGASRGTGGANRHPDSGAPQFASLDAFRPLGERAPDPQIAEAQRREFFNQLHRWLRQDYAVHVFCNNDGERQRFEEIWKEWAKSAVHSYRPQLNDRTAEDCGLATVDCNRHAFARVSVRSGKTRRRHRRGNFWPLQNSAAAPVEIPARAGHPFRPRH